MGLDGLPCRVAMRDSRLHVQVSGPKTNRDYGCAFELVLRPTVKAYLEWLPGTMPSLASGLHDYYPAQICAIPGGVEILLVSSEGTEQLKDRYASEPARAILSKLIAGGGDIIIVEPVPGKYSDNEPDDETPDDDECELDDDHVSCDECGTIMGVDESYEWNGNTLCYTCYQAELPSCDSCSDHSNELKESPKENGDMLCPTCWDEAVNEKDETDYTCGNCGDVVDDECELKEWWHKDANGIGGGYYEYLCPDCLSAAVAEDKAVCDNEESKEGPAF